MCLKIKRALVLLHSFGRRSCDHMTASAYPVPCQTQGEFQTARCVPMCEEHTVVKLEIIPFCAVGGACCLFQQFHHALVFTLMQTVMKQSISSLCSKTLPLQQPGQCPDMDIFGSVEASFPALHWIDIFGK